MNYQLSTNGNNLVSSFIEQFDDNTLAEINDIFNKTNDVQDIKLNYDGAAALVFLQDETGKSPIETLTNNEVADFYAAANLFHRWLANNGINASVDLIFNHIMLRVNSPNNDNLSPIEDMTS